MSNLLNKKLFRHTIIVVGSYTAVSILWILFSDQLVTSIFEPGMRTKVQTYKGIFFVVATAFFLYLLIGTKNYSIKELFEQVRNKMRFFRDTFEQAAVGIAHLSPDEEWLRVNHKLCEMLEYTKHELKSLTLADIVHPDDLEKGKEKDQLLLSGESKSYVMKKRYITKEGNILHARITKSCINNGKDTPKYLIAIIEDISLEKQATLNLKESIKQKDLLIREIHHRVKNNLAIVSGLLELQAYNTVDEKVQKLLKESMMRIKSMALIHESFYQSKKLSYVAFDNYLKDFIKHIETALESADKEIAIHFNSDPIQLNINQAIPLGLLINELVINAYIHAFKDRSKGNIVISIDRNKDLITTKVKDDGAGIPPDFNLKTPSSLGTTIIKTLSRQLDGKLNCKSKEGTEILVSFKKEEKSGSSSSITSSELLN